MVRLLRLGVWTLVSVTAAIGPIPGIPEDLQPPRHEALQDYEFLELLDVQRHPAKLLRRRAKPAAEGPFDDFSGFGLSGPRQWLRTLTPLLGENMLPEKKTSWEWPFKDQEAQELGEGSFGVLYLTKDKNTGEQIAVKLLKSNFVTKLGEGLWITPKMYHDPDPLYARARELVNDSRDECTNMQKIHEGASKDPEGSRHVLKCYHDGITETLNDPNKSNYPLFIVLEYAGRHDLDTSWVAFQNKTTETNNRKDYVNMFKIFTRDIFAGLRFLGENPTDTQWVHHDLKAANIVVNAQPGADMNLVIVDLGTALSTQKLNGSSACTAFSRPPEVCPFQFVKPRVGFKQPIWSYDVFSAAATVLGMATDCVYNQKVAALGVLPYYFYYMQEIVQHSMIRVELLTEAIECGKKGQDFPTTFFACAAEMSSTTFQHLHGQRMNAIKGTQGEQRKAALASLINCRQTGIQGRALQPAVPLGEARPSPFFWALVDQWMATGFDDVLLSALSADPTQRPKPSEILEAQWFNSQEVSEGKEVEFTCPDFGLDDGKKMQIMGVWVLLAILLTCCTTVGAGAVIAVQRKEVFMWKVLLPLAGVLVITVPMAEFYIVSWKYVWLILMVPVGFAMMALSVSLLPQVQAKLKLKKAWYMGVLFLALLLLCLVFFDHSLMLWSWSWASSQLDQEPEKIEGLGKLIRLLLAFLNFFRSYTGYSFWVVSLAMLSLAMDIRTPRRDSTSGSTNDIELPARDIAAV